MSNDFFGTNDADTFYGTGHSDHAFGMAGDDLLYGNDGRDVLMGGGGIDQLYGGLGNDKLRGGLGSDTINGGDGDDIINGGKGSDVLSGGAGADHFIFNQVESAPAVYDEITDFDAATGDTIDVRAFGVPVLDYDLLDNVTNISFAGSNQHITVNGLLDITDFVF